MSPTMEEEAEELVGQIKDLSEDQIKAIVKEISLNAVAVKIIKFLIVNEEVSYGKEIRKALGLHDMSVYHSLHRLAEGQVIIVMPPAACGRKNVMLNKEFPYGKIIEKYNRHIARKYLCKIVPSDRFVDLEELEKDKRFIAECNAYGLSHQELIPRW